MIAVALSISKANPSDKPNESQFNNVIKKVGSFLKGDKDRLKINEGDIIAEVNGIPIYKNEFELRKGLTLASEGQVNDINNFVLSKLVREKVKEYLAMKYNLKVSEGEINSYLEKEKQQFKESPEVDKKLKELISASGMTYDEYWNDYEKYNVKRMLLFDKLYNTIINEGIKSGKLEKTDKMTVDTQNEYKKYVDSIIDQYVKQAKISINDKYKDMFKGFTRE
ncbi:SurA N-terminal domain-containing protein [Thermoanaerobacter wiegelii]|uniref:Uncharacterized protein n=1 Tax=Thermoanaerobacter wiegelii Rt8.B1 TaxID=697303 RepID=G2MW67_9THEO|nr:SurA N-terminal domain-containing protein [Thermoanaerobacter wiegelii]AEM77955.1 hypothetical protein Thewi_0486 [Thermoanaerobacter wiegelii Rt8.B1]